MLKKLLDTKFGGHRGDLNLPINLSEIIILLQNYGYVFGRTCDIFETLR